MARTAPDLSETGGVMTEPAAAPKTRNGQRLCAFGHCLAPLPSGRGIYCSPEHARAARSRQTVDAAARRAAEAEYQRISRGEAPPVPHLGWLTTTHGVVLDGSTVLELHTLIEQHRAALTHMRALVTRPGTTPQALRMHLVDAVDLTERLLLAALHRVLTRPTPRG
jgi:hypothetical protein